MSSKHSLPVEILDRIFYFLRDDIPTLQSSAEVNQDFADIVERHLYHHIVLGNPGMPVTATQFSRLLMVSPHIATYVKSVKISFIMGFLRWLAMQSLSDDVFAHILPRLLHLTTVHLHGKTGKGNPWPSLRPKFQSSFVACIRRPTVVDVSIAGVNHFPLSLLEESPQLERLHLVGNFVSDRPSKEHVVPWPRLQVLAIEPSPTIVGWLAKTNIPHIRSLIIWMHRQRDIDRLSNVLRNFSESLTYLELNSTLQGPLNSIFSLDSNQPPPSVPYLDLSVVPHLQHLHIGAHIHCSNDFWVSSDGQETLTRNNCSTPIPWIIDSLQTLFILPNIPLQSITFNITFVVLKLEFHKISWGPLVDTLKRFDSLKRVELRLTECEAHDSEWLVEALKGDVHLARLVDPGLLLITKSTRKSGYYVGDLKSAL